MDVDTASPSPGENHFTAELTDSKPVSWTNNPHAAVVTPSNVSAATPTIVQGKGSNSPIALSVIQKQRQEERLFDIPADLLTEPVQTDLPGNPIYSISTEQYVAIHRHYITTRLPDDILFPWLHGVDGRSDRQNIFFGAPQSSSSGSCGSSSDTTTVATVPRHRGITLVHADETCPFHARLVDSVLPSEIIDEEQQSFIDVSDPSVNLRNFKIQVARYASISDIVIYGYGADTWARKFAYAQAKLRKDRREQSSHMNIKGSSEINDLEYRVLVIKDPFTTFEQKYPEYVGHDSNGVCINDVNFWEEEKEEIRVMSKATMLTPHVWVGNTQDAPGPTAYPVNDTNDFDDNPNKYSICVEAHDLADMPLPSTLTLARETLNELPLGRLPADIIYLDVYSSFIPQSLAAFDAFYNKLLHLLMFLDDQSSRGRNILIHCSDGYSETSLLVLAWIMYKRKVRLPEAYLYLQERRSFFVYAADILALRRIEHYILTGKQCTGGGELKRKREDNTILPNNNDHDSEYPPAEQLRQPVAGGGVEGAIGDQQLTIKDLAIGSNTVPDFPMDEDDDEDDDGDDDGDDDEDDDEDDCGDEGNGGGSQLDPFAGSGITAPTPSRGSRRLHHDAYINTVSNNLPQRGLDHPSEDHDSSNVIFMETAVPGKPIDSTTNNSGYVLSAEDNEVWADNLQGPLVPTLGADEFNAFPWFYSSRFEGSFPSRILPFLYLGNLNHATNPEMLKALNITRVVSVGEHADLDKSHFKLLFLDNLYDDGIDSIRGRIDEVLRFVDEAHANGENCLIHCRVGVSRSAAITICYVMHYLKVTLIQAYLFVRARRLNVIIQPNLKFMYEMLQLEQDLYGRMMVAWPTLCNAIHQLNMTYR